jgi:hypothetical protein
MRDMGLQAQDNMEGKQRRIQEHMEEEEDTIGAIAICIIACIKEGGLGLCSWYF